MDEYGLDLASLTEIESLTETFETLKADKNDYPVYVKNDGVYYIFDVYDQIGAGTQILGVRYDDQDARVCFTLEEPDIYSALEMHLPCRKPAFIICGVCYRRFGRAGYM